MLIQLQNLSLKYGTQGIFDGLDLIVSRGDRLCIIGRNGVGKSTLLKVISNQVEPDGGQVARSPGLTVAALSQDLPAEAEQAVFDFVAGGLPQLGEDLAAYKRQATSANPDLDELARLQTRIENADGWQLQNTIEQVLTRLDLPADAAVGSLSGGWRRRADLARALVAAPDILLLDEPTNHLDIPAIEWLESLLLDYAGAVVFITHDRAFLRRVANRYGELDRGKLYLADGDFDRYLEVRAARLVEEARHDDLFDKRLAQEETWIRQGIKARRTRNEGRVRALKAMREERAQRLNAPTTSQMALSQSEASGKLVLECEGLSYAIDGRPLVRDLDVKILRGDKVGLIGPNGVGKTTLLKLLLGDLQPDAGRVRQGTRLDVAYYDQLRAQLDLDGSALDNVAEGREFIEVGQTRKHIYAYLADFMFTGERARTPIRTLSGGERNRVLLARLFSKSANLLILDEPTNDLDAETLELLESLLMDYTGTLLLVSHDRDFLDNVVTSTLAFEGRGQVSEYVGGYADWLRMRPSPEAPQPKRTAPVAPAAPPAPPRQKLSYKDARRLAALPDLIERLETAQAALEAQMADPKFYQQGADAIAGKTAQFDTQQQELAALYQEWEALLEAAG